MRARLQGALNRTLERRRAETASEMTILEHLQELRRRIMISVLGLLAATTASFFFAERFIRVLEEPARAAGIEFIATDVTEVFSTVIKVALIGGVAIASPVILSQIILFVAPGLTARERRVLYLVLPLAILFFFLGTLFAYWVVLPRAFDFFFAFGSDLAALMPRISTYLGFVTTLSLWMGLVFETPLIMGILSWLDIVRAATFGRYRRFAVVGAFVAGAFITPTGDPVNLMLVSIPIVVLYEIGALVARFVGRRPIVADLD